LSCHNCAKKLVRRALRSLLCGGGALERSEGEGVVLVAARGRVVSIHLVIVESRSIEFQLLGFVVWFVFVFFVLVE